MAIRSVSWLKDFNKFESSTIYDINPVVFSFKLWYSQIVNLKLMIDKALFSII